MKKFLLHYRAPAEAMKAMGEMTPEQKAAGMKPWMDWKERLGDHLVDMGAPVMGVHTQGPAAQTSGSIVTGYSIVQAENLDAAKQLLEAHPHLSWNDEAAIDIHECMQM